MLKKEHENGKITWKKGAWHEKSDTRQFSP